MLFLSASLGAKQTSNVHWIIGERRLSPSRQRRSCAAVVVAKATPAICLTGSWSNKAVDTTKVNDRTKETNRLAGQR